MAKTSNSQCRGPGLILRQGTRFCKVTIKTQCIQIRPSLVAQMVKNPPATQETLFQSLSWEDPFEEGMATHCSILVWRIPWTEEPGRATVHSIEKLDRTEATEHACVHSQIKKKIKTKQKIA